MPDNEALLARVTRFVSSLAHCNELGIHAVSASENELVMKLPYSKGIIGNPDTGVIHGGAVTTLMDTTSGSVTMCVLPDFELCPTLDLRVDYMKAAIPGEAVFARAICYKQTRNILFIRCEAYQGEDTIAHCVSTFMRIGKDATPAEFRHKIMNGEGSRS